MRDDTDNENEDASVDDRGWFLPTARSKREDTIFLSTLY